MAANSSFKLARLIELQSSIFASSSSASNPCKGLLARGTGTSWGRGLHPAFCWKGGLGQRGERFWTSLRVDGPCNITTLAKRFGTKRDAAAQKLNRLAQVGLTRRDEDGRWQYLARDLDDVARDLDVHTRPAVLAERNARDRVQYARVCRARARRAA